MKRKNFFATQSLDIFDTLFDWLLLFESKKFGGFKVTALWIVDVYTQKIGGVVSIVTTKNGLSSVEISTKNRIVRCIWGTVWLLFYRVSPKIFHSWRCFLLRLFGAKVGRNVHPYPSSKIWAPWNLDMGDNSCLAEGVDCYCVAKVRIGANTTISQYSYLCTASHDYTDPEMPLMVAPIVIGERAWITADVFVGPGVTIGEGAVVTARSSVFTDIEPWVVARGNPAIGVKPRVVKTVS